MVITMVDSHSLKQSKLTLKQEYVDDLNILSEHFSSPMTNKQAMETLNKVEQIISTPLSITNNDESISIWFNSSPMNLYFWISQDNGFVWTPKEFGGLNPDGYDWSTKELFEASGSTSIPSIKYKEVKQPLIKLIEDYNSSDFVKNNPKQIISNKNGFVAITDVNGQTNVLSSFQIKKLRNSIKENKVPLNELYQVIHCLEWLYDLAEEHQDLMYKPCMTVGDLIKTSFSINIHEPNRFAKTLSEDFPWWKGNDVDYNYSHQNLLDMKASMRSKKYEETTFDLSISGASLSFEDGAATAQVNLKDLSSLLYTEDILYNDYKPMTKQKNIK